MLNHIKQQLPKLLFPLVAASAVAFVSNSLSHRYSWGYVPHTPPYLQQQTETSYVDENDMQETARRLNEIEPQSR